jgi:RsiW-degrading membrane proteinase PrsW (M82 family)
MELTAAQWQGLLRLTVYGVEILCALSLVLWLRYQQHRENVSWRYLLALLIGGGLAALGAAFAEMRLFPGDDFCLSFRDRVEPFLCRQGSEAVLAGIIEEGIKYVVGVVLVLNVRTFRQASDAIYYFILIGLGFSLTEDLAYLVLPEVLAPLRLLSFYIHSGTAAIMGYHLGRYVTRRERYTRLMAGIGGAAALHIAYNLAGLYAQDHISAAVLGVLLAAYISLQAFILFRKAKESDCPLPAMPVLDLTSHSGDNGRR